MNRLLIFLGLLWAVTLVLSAEPPRTGEYLSLVFMLAFGMHFAVKILMASESGRRFHQDRQSGAMELLLVTPLPAEDILKGQQAALRNQFHRALWLISIVNVLTLAFAIATFLVEISGTVPGFRSMAWEEIIMASEVLIGSVIMLWLDASTLVWLGMWRGLTAKKYPRSVVATWGQVMLPPWLAFFLFAFMAPVLLPAINRGTMEFFILLWFGFGVVVDVLSITWARAKFVQPVAFRRRGRSWQVEFSLSRVSAHGADITSLGCTVEPAARNRRTAGASHLCRGFLLAQFGGRK